PTGFGNYQPLRDKHSFLAAAHGRPGEQVIIYVELRNMTSAERPENRCFETKLAGLIELRDAQGTLKKTIQFSSDPPLQSKTRHHDFYVFYSFHVPPDLEPGNYQLTVQVVDETNPQAPRTARKSQEFSVSSLHRVQQAPR